MAAVLPKEQLFVLAKAMISEMQTPGFLERVKTAVTADPVPATEEDVLLRYEAVQADFFANRFDLSQLAVAGNAAPATPLDGDDTVRQLREAYKHYKEPEMEKLITQLCVIEESQIESLIATMPQLAAIAQALQQQNAGHNHSHGAGGAGSHGHSHGPGGAMPQMSPQGSMMVDMAMQTLTQEQRNTLDRVQTTMNNGSPPSPEDMRAMFMIQQQIMAFMATMQQFQGRGRGAGGASGRGRGAAR